METKGINDIITRMRSIEFTENFDLVVAIARGGIIPGAMLARLLDLEIAILWLRLRDENHQAVYEEPILLKPINFDYMEKNILLADDRVNTGATFKYAIKLLSGAGSIKTFAVNGAADYSLYQEACFKMPWDMN